MSRIKSSYTILAGVVGNWRYSSRNLFGRVPNFGKCLAVVVPKSPFEPSKARAGIGRYVLLEEMLKETPTDQEFMQLEQIGRWLLANMEQKINGMFEKTENGQIHQKVVVARINNTGEDRLWTFEGVSPQFKSVEKHKDLQSLVMELAKQLAIEALTLDVDMSPSQKLPRLPLRQEKRTGELIAEMQPRFAA